MKRAIIVYCLLAFCSYIKAQTIDYYPAPKKEISKEDYNRGKYFLENTYKQMKDNGNICYADYWNIALAYSYMGEPAGEILNLLKKAKADNAENFCYIANYGMKDKPVKEFKFHKILKADFLALMDNCGEEKNTSPEPLKLKDKSAYA